MAPNIEDHGPREETLYQYVTRCHETRDKSHRHFCATGYTTWYGSIWTKITFYHFCTDRTFYMSYSCSFSLEVMFKDIKAFFHVKVFHLHPYRTSTCYTSFERSQLLFLNGQCRECFKPKAMAGRDDKRLDI